MTQEKTFTAVNSRTALAILGEKKLAYRMIGAGEPIILCNRLRGILDSWDPEFLDALARFYTVVIFDYTGIGSSSGQMPSKISEVAASIGDLADDLKFESFYLLGWSFGGAVAQTFATRNPERVKGLVLLGANPPGNNSHPFEKVFIEATLRKHNDLHDETILFFEPASEFSRAAAERSNQRISLRETDRDVEVPEESWPRYFDGIADFAADEFGAREKLAQINIPLLVISGDHDPACPVENWYALSGKIPNMHLIMMGQSGHGPQQQYPALSVNYIKSFLDNFIKTSQP